MAHTELDLRERRLIEDMLVAKVPVSKIATEIGRHRSTIYREIKRNFYSDEEQPDLDGYYGMNAQRFASARRARRRKLIRLPELRAAVIDRLKEGWSPEQIAGRLELEGHAIRISHETVYAPVYSREGQSEALARYLPSRRKKRVKRHQELTPPVERRFQDDQVEEWSFTDGGVGEDRDADAGRSVGHACVEGVRLGEQADRGRTGLLPEHGEAMAGGGRLVRREGPAAAQCRPRRQPCIRQAHFKAQRD